MKIISTVALILILGCATVRKVGTYSLNRVADLADIVTVTAGVNAYGAKAYIGPLEIGLHKDGIGGYSCLIEHHCEHGNFALFNGMPSGEIGLRKGPAVWTNFGDTVVVNLWERSTGVTRMILRDRGGVGIEKDSASMWGDDFEASPEQYTRIGMTGGFLFNGRIEVNPGELVDFLLGFFGIDIFEDDVIKIRPDYLTSMIVSRKSFQEIKKAIDREGEEPDLIVNHQGDTLLHIAAEYCNIKLIQYLVEEKHYNVNQNSLSDPNNIYPKSTPLGAVFYMKSEESIFLNDCIKAANYLESKGGSYLSGNIMRFFSNQMVKAVKTDDFKFIEKYYSDVDEHRRFEIRNGERYVCIENSRLYKNRLDHDCVVYPNIREIRKLADYDEGPDEAPGASMSNSLYYGGFNVLQIAIYYNRPKTVKYLLEKGADPRHENFRGHNSFHLAEKLSRNEIIEILKQHRGKGK